MKSSQSPTEFEQNNHNVTSIPRYVIKKNRKRGAKHAPSERQRMHHTAKYMLHKGPSEKARTPPNDTCTVVRQRIVQRFVCMTPGQEKKNIMLYDRIALEKHFYDATRAERIHNSKHWILTQNEEGALKPLNQRPDVAQAIRECKRLRDEHLARTQEDF